jgi:guanylate cyclase
MVPLRLVNLLDEVFSSFDDLVEKHGLEKIKTIGDCYMVAAGVPRERADHALALVQPSICAARRRAGHSAARALRSASALIPDPWSRA